MLILRVPQISDWPSILAIANGAAPAKTDENERWLINREQFPEHERARRHYGVEDSAAGSLIGYGAIEETAAGEYRIFVVTPPEMLPTAGDLLYGRLLRDLHDLQARSAWAREGADDTELLAFLRERGFAQRERRDMVDGAEIVVLERTF